MSATPQRHPGIELLARYRAVLAAAWAMRKELAGPKRLADEAAFLPAALALQVTPVHPAPRRAMLAIVMLFVAAVTWAIVGRVDIVAVAPGRIVVSEGTKVVQPLEAAVVRAIHVRDGDKVKAGQVLIELDPTAASADKTSVQEQRRAAGDELRRTEALLAALAGRGLPSPAGQDRTDSTPRAQLVAEWSDIEARLARIDAESARREAEGSTAAEQIAKVQALLPLARQREADLKALSADGWAPAHAEQDRRRERIELERDLATATSRQAEVRAALAESRKTRAALLAEVQRTLRERMTQAKLKLAQLEQEDHKAQRREQLTRLAAPVAGTIQQLAVRTTGGVVTPAQALMVVVPEDAQVSAVVFVENKDIGFVHEGQRAQVKLETFNYTRYGTVQAEVVTVSADAVVDEKRGAGFPVTLRFARGVIDVDGRAVRLAQGMNLTAEIATGRRRVIEYLLSPLRARVEESGRER